MAPITRPSARIIRTPTTEINSTAIKIYGEQDPSFIDSIFVCNTVDNNIFVNIFSLDERMDDRGQLVQIHTQLINQYILGPYESKEILNVSVYNMQSGDTLWGYSTRSADVFTCNVSGRAYNLPTGT